MKIEFKLNEETFTEEVSDEYNWVAMDPDGDVFGYGDEPIQSSEGFWDAVTSDACECLCQFEEPTSDLVDVSLIHLDHKNDECTIIFGEVESDSSGTLDDKPNEGRIDVPIEHFNFIGREVVCSAPAATGIVIRETCDSVGRIKLLVRYTDLDSDCYSFTTQWADQIHINL